MGTSFQSKKRKSKLQDPQFPLLHSRPFSSSYSPSNLQKKPESEISDSGSSFDFSQVNIFTRASGDSRVQRQVLIQRDEENTDKLAEHAKSGLDALDIGAAAVGVGGDSVGYIVKGIASLTGGLADMRGGIEDIGNGSSASGTSCWSQIIGGVSSIANTTTKLLSKDTSKAYEAVIQPLEYIASGAKAVTGFTEGWNSGTALIELTKIIDRQNGKAKQAAQMLYNIMWWKRLAGYSKTVVGAVESVASAMDDSGMVAAATKSYETGWGAYAMRAIGSSLTTAIDSNAQVKKNTEDTKTALKDLVKPAVGEGNVETLATLCKADQALGLNIFSKQAVRDAFDLMYSRKQKQCHLDNKNAFLQLVES